MYFSSAAFEEVVQRAAHNCGIEYNATATTTASTEDDVGDEQLFHFDLEQIINVFLYARVQICAVQCA